MVIVEDTRWEAKATGVILSRKERDGEIVEAITYNYQLLPVHNGILVDC